MGSPSFFQSRQFAAFVLAAVVIVAGYYMLNNHIEKTCIASGGTVISRVDDFSMCIHR